MTLLTAEISGSIVTIPPLTNRGELGKPLAISTSLKAPVANVHAVLQIESGDLADVIVQRMRAATHDRFGAVWVGALGHVTIDLLAEPIETVRQRHLAILGVRHVVVAVVEP